MQRHLMSNGGGGGGGSPSLSPDGIGGGNGPFQSSLASNPHLLYNLIVSKEYFTQLLPYAHLFEPHLISNVTNVIAFYERAHGVDLPRRPAGGMVTGGAVVLAEQSGGGRANHASRASEKDVEKCVQALARAVSRTPMHLGSSSQSPSPNGPRPGPAAGSIGSSASALPPSSHPSFDPAALIERGPFTYHEQENSQDFFIPYIFQLCQTMRILPRMTPDGTAAAPSQTNSPPGPEGSGGGGGSGNMGDVDADAEYMRELYMEEQAANAAPLGLHEEEEEENGGDEDDGFQTDEWTATGNGGRARSGVDRAQTTSPPGDDFSNLRIAIK
jgi:hypothetical protein